MSPEATKAIETIELFIREQGDTSWGETAKSIYNMCLNMPSESIKESNLIELALGCRQRMGGKVEDKKED